jgi:hypothetical protein
VADLATALDSLAGNTEGATLLNSHRMPLPATFSFRYMDVPFDVGIRRKHEGGAELVVRGKLGTIPYSAESVTARDFLQTVVDASRHLPMVDIDIDRKQTIIARGILDFKAAPSPATVAAGTAAIAMAVKPVCDLIAKSRDLPD